MRTGLVDDPSVLSFVSTTPVRPGYSYGLDSREALVGEYSFGISNATSTDSHLLNHVT
jgi:hypothetical protein